MCPFTSYCEVMKCVFLFVGFVANKDSKKSRELHHTFTLFRIIREGMISLNRESYRVHKSQRIFSSFMGALASSFPVV